MKIFLAGDHAGFELKKIIASELVALGHEVIDFGAFEFIPGDDYPDYIFQAAEAVAGDNSSMGIIFGGSGQGEAMVGNRVAGIRAAVFYGPVAPKQAIDVSGELSSDPYSVVRLARIHNDANILSIGARFVTENEAKSAVKIFVETAFSKEQRHKNRLAKF